MRTLLAVLLLAAVGKAQESKTTVLQLKTANLTIGQSTAVLPDLTGSELVHGMPLEVHEYFHESERQRQLKIKGLWTSNLPDQERHAAIAELISKPFYAVMNVDVPPAEGSMGVLPPHVKANVVAVIDEYEMLVNLSWYNERFGTHYGRKVCIQGFVTSGLKEGSEIPVRGVLKVTGKKSNPRAKEGTADIPLLEVMDVSRFMDEAFERQKFDQATQTRAKLQAEMEMSDATEQVASSWLRLGKSHLGDGYEVMARQRFQLVIERYPGSQAAKEARELLDRTAQGVKAVPQ